MTTFHDPREFLRHLEHQSTLTLNTSEAKTLMLASCHVIKYLLESQAMLANKMVGAVDCLNQNHPSWGHKLSELYDILEAGDVDADTMNQILHQEVCSAHVPKD